MSYTCLAQHVVFSTKSRRPLLADDVHARVCEYIGGIVRQLKGQMLAAGGIADHVHLVVLLHPTTATSALVQKVKANSTNWIHETFSDLRNFRWQDEYAAFSVSKSALDGVIAYVRNQAEHHTKMSFEEELIALLNRHGIEYDERYVRS